MRITSKFKDYYDPIAFQMYDKDDHYFWRRVSEFVPEKYNRLKKYIPTNNGIYWVIGFCGKFYSYFSYRPDRYSESKVTYDPIEIKEVSTGKSGAFRQRYFQEWLDEIKKTRYRFVQTLQNTDNNNKPL